MNKLQVKEDSCPKFLLTRKSEEIETLYHGHINLSIDLARYLPNYVSFKN